MVYVYFNWSPCCCLLNFYTRALVALNFILFYFILKLLLLSVYCILSPCCSCLFEIRALVALVCFRALVAQI